MQAQTTQSRQDASASGFNFLKETTLFVVNNIQTNIYLGLFIK